MKVYKLQDGGIVAEVGTQMTRVGYGPAVNLAIALAGATDDYILHEMLPSSSDLGGLAFDLDRDGNLTVTLRDQTSSVRREDRLALARSMLAAWTRDEFLDRATYAGDGTGATMEEVLKRRREGKDRPRDGKRTPRARG